MPDQLLGMCLWLLYLLQRDRVNNFILTYIYDMHKIYMLHKISKKRSLYILFKCTWFLPSDPLISKCYLINFIAMCSVWCLGTNSDSGVRRGLRYKVTELWASAYKACAPTLWDTFPVLGKNDSFLKLIFIKHNLRVLTNADMTIESQRNAVCK